MFVTDTIAGNEKYTGSTIQKAVDKGFSLAVAGKRIGDNKYPHPYGFHDKFDSLGPCKRGMPGIYEFPVERGAVYSGGKVDQLSERVVFQMKVNKGIYCGIITHKVRLSLLEKGVATISTLAVLTLLL